ncbi:MAG: hemerythrin family protein [Okeania sp. SIO3C4]|nr:hemerythrin family protein [Okeania sp. SIO3C4]
MAFIRWDSSLSVGVDKIDEQHQHLVLMANGLHDAMRQGNGKEHMAKLLMDLKTYTQEHFSTEEMLMKEHGYPGMLPHVQEHKKLVNQVLELEESLKTGQAVITIEVMQFLRDWLTAHIQHSDKRCGEFLAQKGVH